MDWDKKARENLLPLSEEQFDLEIALKEWRCTAKVIDHITPSETCQLCENTGLRYHFEIKNDRSENHMLVGSSCILRFNIAVYGEHGELLEGQAREKRLNDTIHILQTESALEALRQLWQIDKERRGLIEYYVRNFEQRNGFEPGQLLFLFQQLRKNKIEYEPAYYKVTLRSGQDQDELLRMSEEDRALLWPSLSASQVRNYPVWEKKKQQKEEALKKQQEEQARLEQERAIRLRQYRERSRESAEAASNSAGFEREIEKTPPSTSNNMNRLRAPSYGKKKAACVFCGQITDDWWYHNGAKNTCKCNECKKLGQV